MSIEALIFDVDGTLADTEETHRQAFNMAFLRLELGWEWSPAEYARLLIVSGGAERIAYYIEALRVPQPEKARLHALAPAIHRIKTQEYAELIADGRAPLRPGIARLMREARAAGVRLAIASTTTGANIDALLRSKTGAQGRFAAVACADQVPVKKPAPDVYRRALGMLRVPPEACVAFEDSENGLRAAQSAGLFTVVTPTGWTAHHDFSKADLLLSHLGDPERPLAPQQAAGIGVPYLELAQLRALHAHWRERRLHCVETTAGGPR